MPDAGLVPAPGGTWSLNACDVAALQKVAALADLHREHVLWRVTIRVGWIFRRTYPVRLKLFIPFLHWLLTGVATRSLPTYDLEDATLPAA